MRKFVLMDGEPGAAGGGAPAGGAGGEGGQGDGKPAEGGQPAGGEGGQSALAKPAPLHERFPEKFRVMKAGEKGEEFDADASTAKVLEAYGALEKRLGSGDAPPKAPEEYKFAVPEDASPELKEAMKDFKLSPEFLKGAHERGITQGQLDYMMGHYLKEAPALAGAGLQRAADAVIASLDKAWGADYDKNLAGAMKTFDAYADEGDKGKFDNIMADPSIAYRILAKVSRELGEAGGVPTDATGASEESIQQLLTSEALANPKHADHKAARAKVDAYYAKKYGTQPIT